MKKNKWKGFLKGVISTTLICSSITVPIFAADTISSSENNIKIMLEGKDRTPPKDTPVILWNGSTYVPLRYIGELMGKEVSWDSATKTVSIDSIDTTKQSETVKPSKEIDDPMTDGRMSSSWANRGVIKVDGTNGVFISSGSLVLENVFPNSKCDYTVEFEARSTRYTLFQAGLCRTKDNFTDRLMTFNDGLYYQKNDASERVEMSKFNPKLDTESYHKIKFEISDNQCNVSIDGNYIASHRLEGEGNLSTFYFQSVGDWEGYYIRNFKLY